MSTETRNGVTNVWRWAVYVAVIGHAATDEYGCRTFTSKLRARSASAKFST